MSRFAAITLACASNPAAAEPAAAREAARAIDLPALPLPAALAALARQTGISLGWPTPLPQIPVKRLRGRFTPDAALGRLLHGTPWRARMLSPGVWRIERAPTVTRGAPRLRPMSAPPTSVGGGDIIVTALKREQPARDVDAAIAVAGGAALTRFDLAPDTQTIARQVVGLSATNLGPGRDRLFIRGVADSPFDGFGQASVSVQLDDARLTYDAPDPDLRLVDIAQVEVLKGPQGPLYGTGALGGVLRLVPNKPELTTGAGMIRIGASATQHGAPAGTLDAWVNVPLIADTLAVRAVAYRVGQGGWIDTDARARDINHGVTSGGRVAVRAAVGANWTIDAQGVTQAARIADSQYSEKRDSLTRRARLPEPQDTDVAIAHLAATGPVGAMTATVSASGTWQELGARYDASSKAAALGGTAPATYRDRREYRVMNYEGRLAGSAGAIDWLAGGSLLSAQTIATGTLSDGANARDVLRFRREISEAALFSEATWRFASRWHVTGGVRASRSAVDDRRRERGDQAIADRTVIRATPSLSLTWSPDPRLVAFARYATAFRPGGVESGIGPGGAASRYRPDDLSTFDLGVRWRSADDRLGVDVGLFSARWSDVQADLIGATGLISTRNAGDAHNLGGEATLRWRPDDHWTWAAGVLAQRARLEQTSAAAAGGDRRLPVVPDLSGFATVEYAFAGGEWHHRAAMRASYVGENRLSFDPGLDRESEPVPLATLSWTAQRGDWTWQAIVDNLLDTRADSFAFGNPFTIDQSAQHTPVRPRTLTVSIARRW
ncbi:TonB-dependent receptor [Sphingomonas sp. RHCKR47]|uniref:TonB-dependent receptor n=1 Tax=Sphingomonas citricola TaxID=2862498 RepID=UPI001CA4B4C1|nr:TonB-dependent receptor [Sphingomonas citricola]MBW6522809.1 TonB-dependent receptor [Sphingomonas citricola]